MLKSAFLGPWVILPIVLSVVFAVLFYPVVSARFELSLAVLLTVIGVGVIWASYVVRAYIFTRRDFRKDDM
jgi:hypothetical protein